MGGVKAFLVWLFSFWSWFTAFFLRWFKAPPLDQARLDTSPGVEQLHSNEGQHESALATFLSSLSEHESPLWYEFRKVGFQLSICDDGDTREFSGDEATYREFLAAVASSKVICRRRFVVRLAGHDSSKHLEEIVGALLSNNNFKTVDLSCGDCSALRMAECVSNLLSGNDVIQDLKLRLHSKEVVGKEAAEQLANGLHTNQVLERLDLLWNAVDDEGMEVLVKPLKDPHSVLQRLRFGSITDVGLEHLGVMLATNASLKDLEYWDPERGDEVYMRGYTSLQDALCSNRTLECLKCTTTSSMELEALLEPLMPVNNIPQANTTVTTLWLSSSKIGGKEGVDILVDMIRTNTSLLTLDLFHLRELDDDCPDAVENVVAILEALKTNKSLKRIRFGGCGGVGGYKVLGTMMDLLLENQHLENIDLTGTPLERSGDAAYVHAELKKRKKMKLGDLIQGMANVSPKSGRVFLCGNPYAGKTTLRKSIKELFDFQNMEAFQNKRSSRFSLSYQGRKIYDKIRVRKERKVLKIKEANERTCGIEVDHMECDGIGISIWDMAGQTDYHSFHDLVVPNLSADGSCSLFLLICNPIEGNSFQKCNISDIKSELEYWLRFIASNTRRSWLYRPHVSIVMTHFDYWNNENEFTTRIEDIVMELKSQFEEVLEFDPNRKIFKVDGEDVSYARMVFNFIKIHLKQLLGRLPKTMKACRKYNTL